MKLKCLDDEENNSIIAIHFDIYTTKTNMNLIFYELLFLNFINNNHQELFKIKNNIKYYFEIANTMNNKLLESHDVLKLFNKITLH